MLHGFFAELLALTLSIGYVCAVYVKFITSLRLNHVVTMHGQWPEGRGSLSTRITVSPNDVCPGILIRCLMLSSHDSFQTKFDFSLF
jgi:hypothetical protein